MKSSHDFSLFGELKHDLPAGLIVFLVAVPLCLGIALASDAPLFSGIIAGIVGGIVAGALSGSPLGVSGPAAGLAVIVLSAIKSLGSFEVFLLALVLGGAIQLILGFAKAGIIAYYFPSSVIKGMLSGIGIIIILKQIPHGLGYDKDAEGELGFIQPDGENTFTAIWTALQDPHWGAIVITLAALGVLVLWEQEFMKKIKIFQIIQGPLVAVASGIGLTMLFEGHETLGLTPDHLVAIPVADSFMGFFDQFTFPDFTQLANKEVYIIAITIAVVASLETLLCVEATDKLDPWKRVTPTNRELKAQGVANMLSGLIGGLPVTQVIVRSSANIQSGGRTKLSAILHGFLLLASVMAIPSVLNMVPLACLASILFLVGYKLAKPALFKTMYKYGWPQFLPFIVTILGIVFTDLLIGIGLGLAFGIFYILYNNYKKPYYFYEEEYEAGHPVRIELTENVSFLNKASILNTLDHMPDDSKVIIDASKTVKMDLDVYEIIMDFQANAKLRCIELELIGFEDKEHLDPLKRFHKVVVQ